MNEGISNWFYPAVFFNIPVITYKNPSIINISFSTLLVNISCFFLQIYEILLMFYKFSTLIGIINTLLLINILFNNINVTGIHITALHHPANCLRAVMCFGIFQSNCNADYIFILFYLFYFQLCQLGSHV